MIIYLAYVIFLHLFQISTGEIVKCFICMITIIELVIELVLIISFIEEIYQGEIKDNRDINSIQDLF